MLMRESVNLYLYFPWLNWLLQVHKWELCITFPQSPSFLLAWQICFCVVCFCVVCFVLFCFVFWMKQGINNMYHKTDMKVLKMWNIFVRIITKVLEIKKKIIKAILFQSKSARPLKQVHNYFFVTWISIGQVSSSSHLLWNLGWI